MAAAGSSPPSNEAGNADGEGSLPSLSAPQSLRDLLAATNSATGNGGAAQRRRAAGASSEAAALLSSNGDRIASSSGAGNTSGIVTDPPPHRSENRWNGWHMWRQESADAKRMREQARDVPNRREASFASSTSARGNDQANVRIRMKRWSRRFYGSIKGIWTGESYIDEEEDGVIPRESAYLFNDREEAVVAAYDPEAPLSSWKLGLLTVSLAGAQVAWTLELAYGTPFLLGLGLSKEAVSLVWLAGPASGLIVQPLIGAISDADMYSRFRRRKFMLLSAAILTLSTLVLAFASPISFFVVDIFGVGLGDWDPKRNAAAHRATQFLSVSSFWVLDFALNGLQASSRALILDVSPSHQQTSANAWQGIMSNVGNVVGYFVGWVNLANWSALRWLGGGQFRRFAVFSILSMWICVGTTCASTTEHPDYNTSREGQQGPRHVSDAKLGANERLRKIIRDIWNTVRRLPRPIRRVCITQFFNFSAWFGFLFYATQYYLEVKAMYVGDGESTEKEPKGHGDHPTQDDDFEQGSFAMLMYAVIALVSGSVLSHFALGGDGRASAPTLPDFDVGTPAIEDLSGRRRLLPGERWMRKRMWRVYRGLRYGMTLRTLWSLGCFLFFAFMVGTFFVRTPTEAIILIGLIGVPWSITAWAPYALIGEFVREASAGTSPYEFDDDHHGPRQAAERRRRRRMSQAAAAQAENGSDAEALAQQRVQASLADCKPLPGGQGQRPSLSPITSTPPRRTSGGAPRQGIVEQMEDEEEAAMAGTVLGIHNLAIVLPQLMMSFIATAIFQVTDVPRQRHGDEDDGSGGDADDPLGLRRVTTVLLSSPMKHNSPQVSWVLRFGGLLALAACFLARTIPLTRTERTRRGELVDLHLDFDEEDADEGVDGGVSGAGHGPVHL